MTDYRLKVLYNQIRQIKIDNNYNLKDVQELNREVNEIWITSEST